jgi:hypothetical protein
MLCLCSLALIVVVGPLIAQGTSSTDTMQLSGTAYKMRLLYFRRHELTPLRSMPSHTVSIWTSMYTKPSKRSRRPSAGASSSSASVALLFPIRASVGRQRMKLLVLLWKLTYGAEMLQ